MSQLEQLIGAMDAVTTGRGRTTQPDDRLEGVASEDDSDDEASQMEKQMAVARMQEQMVRAMAYQQAQHNPNGVTVMNVGGPKPNIIPMSALDPAQMAQLAAYQQAQNAPGAAGSSAVMDPNMTAGHHLASLQQQQLGGAKPRFRPMNPLCDAAEQGDLPKLTTLIAQRGDVNITGENGNSALAFACANGHADCTSLLLRHGAQVNQRSSLGNAPLHAACWADSSKCLRQLLDAKAEINLQSCSGSTPMHVAIHGGRAEALALLLARGADRSIKCEGKSPVQYAIGLGHAECEKVLRDFDAKEKAAAAKVRAAELEVAEAKANAAADALLAELEEEEAASKSGKKKNALMVKIQWDDFSVSDLERSTVKLVSEEEVDISELMVEKGQKVIA